MKRNREAQAPTTGQILPDACLPRLKRRLR